VQKCGEEFRRVETTGGHLVPTGTCENFRIRFEFPKYFEYLPLGVVVEAG
jgi:hypothetical protein